MPPPRLTASTSGNSARRGAISPTKRRRFSSNSSHARAGAEVGVNRDDRQLGRGGARAQRRQRLVPDAVLGRRAAGVARLDVAVAEARVHAHRDRPGVAGAAQLVDHPGRADVGQHAVLEHDGERVVAQHVGGQHHDRRLGAHREAGPTRAQHLVAADGVDPEPGGAHRLQHLPAGVRLHRVAGLQRVARGQRGERRQPPAQLARRRRDRTASRPDRRGVRADRKRDRATASPRTIPDGARGQRVGRSVRRAGARVGHPALRLERRRRAPRQHDGEGGAGAERAGDGDAPAQRLAQLAGDPEPEAQRPECWRWPLARSKRRKIRSWSSARDADAVIAHDELDGLGRRRVDLDLDGRRRRRTSGRWRSGW